MSTSLIVAVNKWCRFQQRTDTSNEKLTNYSDYDNEKLTNTGLENLETVKVKFIQILQRSQTKIKIYLNQL